MKFYKKLALIIVASVTTACIHAQDFEAKLVVGDKAPPLKLGGWIKGNPISRFEPGKVYIVEFTAVSCSPCRAAIPHLNELAKKYEGKAMLISVFIWGESYNMVKNFAENMGNTINYNMVVDDKQRSMESSWAKASGKTGIPTVFVIDQQVSIAWIGGPYETEEVVDDILSGNYDPQVMKIREAQRIDAQKKLGYAMKRNDFKSVDAYYDSMIATNPKQKYYYYNKFENLLKLDEIRAYTFGWEILNNYCKDTESVLWYVARSIVDKESLKNPDLDLVIALTERAVQLSKSPITSAMILETQMQAYVKRNAFEKAVKAMERAMDYLDSINRDDINPHTYNYLIERCKWVKGKAEASKR